MPVLNNSTFCMSDADINSFENVAFILRIPPNLLHIKEVVRVAIILCYYKKKGVVMYCYNCGKKLVKNANYCVYCGKVVIIPDEEEKTVEESTKIAKESSIDSDTISIPILDINQIKKEFPKRITDKPVKLDREVLEERLKSYRKSMADIEGNPPFCVFNNTTLASIIEILPTTYEEMKNVYGLGDAKISKYGKDIIEIINQLDMNNI